MHKARHTRPDGHFAKCSRRVGVSPTLSMTYPWGTDLSGSLPGAGGVGGLPAVQIQNPQSSIYYPSYDGNHSDVLTNCLAIKGGHSQTNQSVRCRYLSRCDRYFVE
jgi:hypothetical protein